ncbi:hypothetical protein BDN72DRAFT_349113 [Pluteus cervinus]|uniref:Uncharacterized protein n=1 Tax=Pluteus cervinus TaxID=181527 RepID=A0ACD3BC73_9AGAR|nr:hypothetical protein BDN72DRAFT_349113 [Pluteus cervinus]
MCHPHLQDSCYCDHCTTEEAFRHGTAKSCVGIRATSKIPRGRVVLSTTLTKKACITRTCKIRVIAITARGRRSLDVYKAGATGALFPPTLHQMHLLPTARCISLVFVLPSGARISIRLRVPNRARAPRQPQARTQLKCPRPTPTAPNQQRPMAKHQGGLRRVVILARRRVIVLRRLFWARKGGVERRVLVVVGVVFLSEFIVIIL